MQGLGGDGSRRGLADVDLKKALEQPGVSLEGAEDRVAENRRAIHQEQAAGHEAGEALDASVSLLI